MLSPAVPVVAPAEPEPFIPAATEMAEFTWRAVITGTVLGMVFGASSLYLVLKVGLTVSASIPVAVIALAMFRGLSRFGVRDSTILENNITQTAGSAGESIAFGVGVTMPAILILGFDLELTRVLLVAVLGGLLGILMMIPLRRALIVKEHATLKYPEGTACAAVLKAGATPADRALASPSAQAEMRAAEAAGLGQAPGAKVIFAGFFTGLVYKTFNIAFKGWKDIPEKVFGAPFNAGSVSIEISPELLGVGYIIGPRIASITAAGGVLAFLVLIPLIKFIGQAAPGLIVPPGAVPIADMSPGQIRDAYVLYIGSGAVAAGGIISLFRALPTIWHGLRSGLRDVGLARADAERTDAAALPRTERDLPIKFVGIGVLVLLGAITLAPALHMNMLGALLILLFGFIFVTVSSRLTGEVGSSSNPISGMTVATLLLTCLAFLLVGWTGNAYYITALSVGGIVCVASSNGGTTSQDLKTGYLLGGTPYRMQWAILIGAFASALVLGPILLQLNRSGTVYVPAATAAPGLTLPLPAHPVMETLHGRQARDDDKPYAAVYKTDPTGGPTGKYLLDPATGRVAYFVDPGFNGTYTERPDGTKVQKFNPPKATLVSYIIKGILDRNLPWALVLLGVMIALTLELCGIPSLVFAVGVYLPISSSAPLFVGGAVRWLADRYWRRRPEFAALGSEEFTAESDKSPGVLLSSGLIAGGAIAGIVVAFLAGLWSDADTYLDRVSKEHNPFFEGAYSDALSMLPFAAMVIFLFLVAREHVLSARRR